MATGSYTTSPIPAATILNCDLSHVCGARDRGTHFFIRMPAKDLLTV